MLKVFLITLTIYFLAILLRYAVKSIPKRIHQRLKIIYLYICAFFGLFMVIAIICGVSGEITSIEADSCMLHSFIGMVVSGILSIFHELAEHIGLTDK